jgi:hypothetical protein
MTNNINREKTVLINLYMAQVEVKNINKKQLDFELFKSCLMLHANLNKEVIYIYPTPICIFIP